MAVLLITYDLNQETKRPNITKAVKNVGDGWAMLSESSYAVATSKSPSVVYNELKPLLDSNDQIYVINLKLPYEGFGPVDINKWLDDNLTY